MCGGVLEPNTNPHLVTHKDIVEYVVDARIVAPDCRWIGSAYLTPHSDPKEILKSWREKWISHVKWYPPHGSTHSGESVRAEDLLNVNGPTGRILSMMQDEGIPLKNHPELTSWAGMPIKDPYKRETAYFRNFQRKFRLTFPTLRQILAHISTSTAAKYAGEVEADNPYLFFEMTPHHLAFDTGILYDGGFIMPDHHCLPVIKDFDNREDLHELLSKKPKNVGAGSDMAGHDTKAKYGFRGFGGIYTYHCSLELYVQVLDQLGRLDFAHDFLYGNAKRFHGDLVPDDPKPIKLVREQWTVNSRITYAGGEMTPFGYHDEEEKRFKFRWKIAA
jgi:dihydroorotase